MSVEVSWVCRLAVALLGSVKSNRFGKELRGKDIRWESCSSWGEKEEDKRVAD
jgi:hypothetical protein